MPVSSVKKAKKGQKKAAKKATKKEAAPKKKESKDDKKLPPKTVQAWLDRVNADRRWQGKAQIRTASEVQTPYALRRPSGLTSLDIALGGGLHAGGIAEIQGIKSAGKTYLAFTFAAKIQELYGEAANILIYAVEIRPDKHFARMAGFCIAYSEKEIEEMERIRVSKGLPPFTDEEHEDLRKQIGNVVVIVADTAETGLGIVDSAMEAGLFHLVIIESLGAFLTKEGEEKEVGQKLYAGATIAMTSFMNKVYPKLLMDRPDGSMLETTILGINQARAKMNANSRFERTERAAMGAFAWQHGQLLNVVLERGSKLRDGEKGPVIGREVDFVLEKGKAGTHDGLSGVYRYYYLPKIEPVFWKDVEQNWYGGIDVHTDLVETAKSMDMFETSGSWLSYKIGKEVFKAQSVEKFAEMVGKNPELASVIREDAMKRAGVMVRYK